MRDLQSRLPDDRSLERAGCMNRQERIHEAVRVGILGVVGHSSGLLDRVPLGGPRVGRESDDDDRGSCGCQPAGSFDSAHPGHGDVHHDDVGFHAFAELESLYSVSSFADDLELWTFVEQLAQCGTHMGVVVSDEYPDHPLHWSSTAMGSSYAFTVGPRHRGFPHAPCYSALVPIVTRPSQEPAKR